MTVSWGFDEKGRGDMINMRVKKVMPICVALIFACCLYVFSIIMSAESSPTDYNSTEMINDKLISINTHFLGQVEIDTSIINKRFGFPEGYLLTFYRVKTRHEDIASTNYEQNIANEIDFDKYYVIISYGRRIYELDCINDTHFGTSWYRLIVTFDEGHYGNMAYYYKIDKRNYIPPTLAEMECYSIEGSAKYYLGSDIFEINNITSDDLRRWSGDPNWFSG